MLLHENHNTRTASHHTTFIIVSIVVPKHSPVPKCTPHAHPPRRQLTEIKPPPSNTRKQDTFLRTLTEASKILIIHEFYRYSIMVGGALHCALLFAV